jgi:hypothetical protein
MATSDPETIRSENLRTVYRELCTSYRAIDDFRGKLLGFLPLVSGTGIFLLIHDPSKPDIAREVLLPVALFGLLVTLGLFVFEIYGIRRCSHLIILGKSLETQLRVDGQFTHRPVGLSAVGKSDTGLFRFVSEPLASGIVYSAVIGAWVFLICWGQGKTSLEEHSIWILPVAAFIAALSISQRFNYWLHEYDGPSKNLAIVARLE